MSRGFPRQAERENVRFGKELIRINCVLFLCFGLGFALAPAALSLLITESAPATPGALTDMRASYGGMALGLAIIFGLCAVNRSLTRLGVQGVLAVMAALASARLLGILVDGAPNAWILALFVAELVMAALAAALLYRQPPQFA